MLTRYGCRLALPLERVKATFRITVKERSGMIGRRNTSWQLTMDSH
jgi:hypothetical protein